jgi:tricorn protease
MTLTRFALALAWMTSGLAQAATSADATLMLRQPAISKHHLAFVYGGDLWLADRDGGNARRLTSHAASEFAPRFSPDGRQVAFSASYDGNTDVYVIGLDGGDPKRLTWHPSTDVVSGWSPDGRRVLFASPREVLNNRSNQLYEVSVDGGYERQVMKAVAYEGAWSPDGKRLAYRPYNAAYAGVSGWRQSRGGTTPPVWIMDMASQQWEQIPHVNATDSAPVWAQSAQGLEVVFISDRADGAANLFAFNPATKALRQLTRETQWDVRSVDALGTTLVYEAGGRIKQIELAGADAGQPRVLDIRLVSSAPLARTQWRDAGKALASARLSSTGKRVVVSARGEVFTVPVKDGSLRNLTETAGVREKDALWSMDGQRIAYVSDAPGMRHEVVLVAQSGLGARERFLLPKEGYFTLAEWSPDGQQLVLQDNHLNLYRMGLAAGPQRGRLVKIATDVRRGSVDIAFSPDSRWLAYTSSGDNYFGRVWLHEIATGRNHAVTDGLAHAATPTFSAKGDTLFFTASINTGPSAVGLDLSTQERPRRAGLYALVLAAGGKSPLSPKAGDEDGKKDEAKTDDEKDDKKKDDKKDGNKKDDKKKEEKKPEPVKPIKVDVAGLADRVVALPVPERNYDRLAVAADGSLFYLQRPQPGASVEPPQAERRATAELWRFDFEERKPKMLRSGVADFSLSEDHKKLLLTVAGGKLEVGDANEKIDAKPLDLSGLRTRVDLRAEWRQIFDETWWMQREFFYDPGMHGLDWQGVHDRYLPQLAHVQRREDLNDLLVQMIAELQVGHNRVGGGDVHQETPVAVGLLGADFAVEQGRYRIARLYPGDRLNPNLRSPLAVPGLGVKEGDFILAIGGQALDDKTNLYARLENTVGKQVVLTLARDAAGTGRRDIVVEPIASEALLRRWAWIEGNRRYVEQKTGGKVAYVYMPDTGGQGFEHFNRMFFAQVDKQALIVDDRKNGGGQAANYVTELLARPYLGSWKDRDGLVFDTPGGAIYGPKAMLIDQDAGSGGDFMPYAFKRVGLGPLIGKRTWGGLIGISVNPPLIDDGFVTVPFFRFYTPEGEWRIENEGVAPDIDVELDPAAVNRGEDTQLDAAIADVMKRLAAWKPVQRRTAPTAATLGR